MKKNRILCLALSLVMLLGIVFPVNVLAEDIILEDEEYEEYYENGNDFVEEILVEEETEIVNDVVEQIEDEVVVVEEEAEQELVEEESPAVLDDEKIGIEEPANTEVVEAEMTLVEAEAFSTTGPAITEQPEDVSAASGEKFTLHVKATGTGLSYQWKWKAPGGAWRNASSADAKKADWEITMDAKYDGRQYQCVITDANGNSVTSDAVTVSLAAQIVIDGVTYKPLTETTCAAVAYDNDPSRTSLNIPKIVDNKYTVTEIGEANNSKGVFEGCTALTSIDLPNDITVIHARAFKDCTNLSTMTTH